MRRQACDIEGHAHEITFCTNGRVPHFHNEDNCKLFLDHLGAARERLGFCIWAYVLMPDHVHLVIWPGYGGAKVADVLKSIKQPFARRMKSLGRCGDRFWLAGGGYDRNLVSMEAVNASIDYLHRNPIRKGPAEDVLGYRWSSAMEWYGVGKGYLAIDALSSGVIQ